MTSNYWDKVYDRHRAEHSTDHSEFAQRALDYIKKHDLKKMLDIGPGIGSDTRFFYEMGMDLTAIDISGSVLYSLKIIIPTAKTILSDITDMDFPAHSFDCVYARLSLHYFNDETTGKIFNKIYDILVTGGILFVQCKSEKDRDYGVGEMIEKDTFYKPDTHIRHFFTLDYFREKATRFKIVELDESSSFGSNYSNLIAQK